MYTMYSNKSSKRMKETKNKKQKICFLRNLKYPIFIPALVLNPLTLIYLYYTCTQAAPSYKNTDNAAACTPTLRMAQGSCPRGSSHTGQRSYGGCCIQYTHTGFLSTYQNPTEIDLNFIKRSRVSRDFRAFSFGLWSITFTYLRHFRLFSAVPDNAIQSHLISLISNI